MFSLSGKVAVVTGGGSGIGAAICECFAAAGAALFVVDREPAGANAVVARINQKDGGRAAFVFGDVSDEASCNAVAHGVLGKNSGRCDVVVNNAGIGHVGTILTTTPADLDRLYAVNVKGVMHMTRAFLPGMIERRSGSVVNMASIGGIVGIRDRLAYTATKFAVVGITKSSALDYAETKVRFNCICPGRVETPWVAARIKEYPDPKKAYEEMAASQAQKRMGRPEEIAAAALYLAADESEFVTGSALIIDGGFSAGK
jgi:NAD(P)-dependent dehydrogenase (short-subunit alcohol dehydrogenase family)